MPEPYIAEIRMFAGNFAPAGWAFCSGQLMPISENDAMFVVIGTTYGGDGQETFALPNLQSRIPMHAGNGHILGESGGVESVTLSTSQIPSHTHPALCKAENGTQSSPVNNFWAGAGTQLYVDPPNAVPAAMNAAIIQGSGGNQPHENMGPYLVINFIISLYGVFPAPP